MAEINYKNGTYKGDIGENGLPNGYGVYKTEKLIFKGYWTNGLPTYGNYTFDNLDSYQGHLGNDTNWLPHGQGTYFHQVSTTNTSYIMYGGEWTNGFPLSDFSNPSLPPFRQGSFS